MLSRTGDTLRRILGFFHWIEQNDEEGAEGAEEEGGDEPEEAAAVFGLGEAGVDEGEGEPADGVAAGVVREFHNRELHRAKWMVDYKIGFGLEMLWSF